MRAHELQKVRARLDMTQRELGSFVGVGGKYPHRTVRNWESARTAVPEAVAVALMLELEVRRLRRKIARMEAAAQEHQWPDEITD